MVLRKEITTRIKDLLKKNPQGLSITEIVGATSINRNTAGRYLENLLVSGQVEMRRFGMAKIYMLSQRVPLSAVLSISSELVLQLDSNLRIIFTNEPFLDLIGTDEKEILGKNIEYTPIVTVFDDIFPWFIIKVREGLNGKEASGDISLPLKDLVFFFRIAPTVFEDGRKGVSVILEDITEQRRADDALRESQDRYRKLVEISPDAVFLHREGKILYANPAAFRLLGASHSDEIIGRNILNFVPSAFQDPVRNNIQKDLEGQTSPRIELPMFRIDGTTIMVEGRGIATVSDGKPAVQVAIRDITEQKQAEEALKIKERQLFSIYSNVPDALFYLSVEPGYRFRFLTVNQSFLNKVHMSEDQVVGKYVDEGIPEPLFSRARGKCIQAIREKKTIHWEEVQEYPNARRYGDAHVTAVFDESGRPTNIIGSVHDSTEHKQLEESLRESEATARALLNAPTDSVIVLDDRGIVLALNEIAASRFGKRSADLVGVMSYDLLPKEVAQLRRALMAPVLEKKESVRFEDERAGRWYDTVAYPILNDAGDVKKIAIIARDITEQKNSEKQLRESEQMYRLLLEQSFDAIAIHKEGKIAFLNERAAKILGAARPEDLTGRSIFDFIHPESRKDLQNRIGKLSTAPGNSVPVITEKFFRTDGTTVTVEVMAISFNDNGIPAFRVAFREIGAQ
jgi:PAS domain S-box-containing protein